MSKMRMIRDPKNLEVGFYLGVWRDTDKWIIMSYDPFPDMDYPWSILNDPNQDGLGQVRYRHDQITGIYVRYYMGQAIDIMRDMKLNELFR
jgi:hypothetical protein